MTSMATAHLPDSEPTAVAALRGLLSEFPDPLPEAWAAVHVDDLVSTVQRLDWQQLERLLSVLHALSPPSPERPACAVILELARQPALQGRITSVVTAPVRRGLHEVYAGEQPLDQLLNEWPRPVVRLALLKDLTPGRDAAQVTGAAVLELLNSGLAPAAWSERRDELVERARATRASSGTRLELAYAATADADGGVSPDEPAASARTSEPGTSGPQQMIDRAATALDQAKAAWERMGAALDSGSGPGDRDLDTVEAVGVTLKDAAAALRAALAEIGFDQEVAATLPSLRAARDRWEALRLPEARAAHRLEQVDGPEDVAYPLELLRELTAGLVERAGRWDEEDRSLAEFGHRLAALIDAGAHRSTPIGELLELYNAATAAAPAEDFAPVFLLAIRGALTLPPDVTDTPEDPDPRGPGSGNREPASAADETAEPSASTPELPPSASDEPPSVHTSATDGPTADVPIPDAPTADVAPSDRGTAGSGQPPFVVDQAPSVPATETARGDQHDQQEATAGTAATASNHGTWSYDHVLHAPSGEQPASGGPSDRGAAEQGTAEHGIAEYGTGESETARSTTTGATAGAGESAEHVRSDERAPAAGLTAQPALGVGDAAATTTDRHSATTEGAEASAGVDEAVEPAVAARPQSASESREASGDAEPSQTAVGDHYGEVASDAERAGAPRGAPATTGGHTPATPRPATEATPPTSVREDTAAAPTAEPGATDRAADQARSGAEATGQPPSATEVTRPVTAGDDTAATPTAESDPSIRAADQPVTAGDQDDRSAGPANLGQAVAAAAEARAAVAAARGMTAPEAEDEPTAERAGMATAPTETAETPGVASPTQADREDPGATSDRAADPSAETAAPASQTADRATHTSHETDQQPEAVPGRGTADGGSAAVVIPTESAAEATAETAAETTAQGEDASPDATAADRERAAPAVSGGVAAERERAATPPDTAVAAREELDPQGEADLAGGLGAEREGAAAALPGLFGRLLGERRFGLAYWLAVAARRPEGVTQFLRMCAQVQAVRNANGEGADALRRLLRDAPSGTLMAAGPLHPLALSVAARACLTAPFSGAAAQVPELTRNVTDLPALSEIVRAAAATAERGISLPDVGAPAVDLAAAEAELRGLSAQARQFVGRERHLDTERGARIWRRWTAPGGLLARLLGPVTDGDLTRVGARATELLDVIDRLAALDTAERDLREQDRQLRGATARPLDGRTRRALLALAGDAATLARTWADAARRLETGRAAGQPDWVAEPLAELRAVVVSNEAAARAELDQRRTSANPVESGAAAGAAGLLDETLALVATLRLDGDEPAPARTLGADLLRSGVALTSGLAPRDPATLSAEAVAAAVDRSWEDAFNTRMGAGQYGTAAAVLEELRAEQAAQSGQATAVLEDLEAELDTARGYAVTLVREHTTELLDDIRRARRRGGLTEWGAADLTSRLEATLERTEPNLDVVSEVLDGVAGDLEQQQREAAAQVRRVLSELRGPSEVTDQLGARVDALLEEGHVAAAEELLELAREQPESAAEQGAAVAELDAFFPMVSDAMPDGVDTRLITTVRERATAGPLDFGRLTAEDAAAAADALAGWREVAAGPWHERQLQTLVPALRLCGIEAATGEWLALPRSSQRRWANLLEVRTTGTSPLPQFGSAQQGRLRLLLCWKHPSASTLLDWLEQDSAAEPTVVLHFGTVNAEQRLRLAAECRRRHPGRAVVVVDDAVLAYAAATGHGQLDAVLRNTLPFTAINPFVPDSGSDVPPELFFGRREQIRRLVDPDGTSLVFGGRQVGKSALLRAAARDFERSPGHVAVFAQVGEAKSGGRTLLEAPQLVWSVTWRALVAAGIADDRHGAHTDGGQDDAARVAEAVRAWLDGDPARRLLLLLDDCDAFLEGDAAVGFANTLRLTTLRDRSDRRMKPVFAGAHTVQRFAQVPNRPLAQLGRPAPVGPLAPRAAYDLVSRPLAALGLELATPELADRVLAECDYQPVLLQRFGHALVERVLAAGGPDSLPQVVDAETVDAVAGSAELRDHRRAVLDRTLDLDGRYRVIAHVAAAAAQAGGADTALTARELRARCDGWSEAGLDELAADAFRGVLEELVGLGVLVTAPGGRYRLRSSGTLRVLNGLGDPSAVEDALVKDGPRGPELGALVVTERRVVLDDTGSRSPLTEQQLADVIGEGRNQVRVVLGSPATGVGRVVAALETAARSAAFALVKPRNRSYFEQALRAARDRGHWVVVSLLCGEEERQGVSVAGCAASLEKARTAAGGSEATRSVVLVTDERNLDWWLQLFSPGLNLEGSVELVELRRYDERSLAAWALDGSRAFHDPAARAALLRVTGGWPLLVDRAAELAGQGATANVTLETIRAELAGVDGALRLVRAAGVGCPPVAPLWDHVVTLGEEGRAPADELVEVLADGPGDYLSTHAGLEVLRALQALVREPDGTLGPEPVLAAAWRRVKA